jgi:hypothetical protein
VDSYEDGGWITRQEHTVSRKKAKKDAIGGVRRTWHRLENFFTSDSGVQPTAIDGVPVFVPGAIRNVVVVQVPMTASPSQIESIAAAIKRTIGQEPIVVTTNVKFLRLVPVDESEVRHGTILSPAGVPVRDDGNGHVADGVGAGDSVLPDAATEPDGKPEDPIDPAAGPRES